MILHADIKPRCRGGSSREGLGFFPVREVFDLPGRIVLMIFCFRMSKAFSKDVVLVPLRALSLD